MIAGCVDESWHLPATQIFDGLQFISNLRCPGSQLKWTNFFEVIRNEKSWLNYCHLSSNDTQIKSTKLINWFAKQKINHFTQKNVNLQIKWNKYWNNTFQLCSTGLEVVVTVVEWPVVVGTSSSNPAAHLRSILNNDAAFLLHLSVPVPINSHITLSIPGIAASAATVSDPPFLQILTSVAAALSLALSDPLLNTTLSFLIAW